MTYTYTPQAGDVIESPDGFGMMGGRVVFDADRAIAPQRPFEKEAQ